MIVTVNSETIIATDTKLRIGTSDFTMAYFGDGWVTTGQGDEIWYVYSLKDICYS